MSPSLDATVATRRFKPRRVLALAAATVVLAGLALGVFRVATSAPVDGYGVSRAAEFTRDCDVCPALLTIPTGTYMMGSEVRLWKRSFSRDARPQRQVAVTKPFALGVYEVTFREWDACVAGGGCDGRRPNDHGWGRGDRPVVDVSFHDVQGYLRWLSAKTGRRYRLPTEAEWEYAARAGTTTPYPWGRWASHAYANYGEDAGTGRGKAEDADQWHQTAPVGSFPANRFGLHDMAGNVYEWVEDCYVFGYATARGNAEAVKASDCRNVIRGGCWYSDPLRVRAAYRGWQTPDQRAKVIGVRVARDL